MSDGFVLSDNTTSLTNFINETLANTTNLTCRYTKTTYLNIRFPLFVVFMPTISLIGIIGNIISILTFNQRELRNTNNFFLSFLGACNIGVLTTATMTYSVENASDYFESVSMYVVWLKYLPSVYYLSNAFQTCSVYFTIGATMERWYTAKFARTVSDRIARSGAAMIVILCFGLNAVRIFEFGVYPVPYCVGFASFKIDLASFAKTDFYQTFTFWLWAIVSVLIPFTFLTVMNIVVIQRFHQAEFQHSREMAIRRASRTSSVRADRDRDRRRKSSAARRKPKEIRAKQREATLLLICVVSLFLVCNLPGFVLSLIEIVAMPFLHQNRTFYGFARDSVNFMAVVDSSSGFFLYVIFGQEFRKMSKLMLFRVAGIGPAFQLIKGISDINDMTGATATKPPQQDGLPLPSVDTDQDSGYVVYYV